MTEVELKLKAKEFCLKIKHDDGEIWYGLEDIEPMLIHFTTEATKELLEEVNEWKENAECALKELKMLQEDLELKKIAIQSRNKRIKELEKRCNELFFQVNEQVEQIEKMKNWCNCGNYQDCLIQRAEEGKGLKAEECHNCNKWRFKEKVK